MSNPANSSTLRSRFLPPIALGQKRPRTDCDDPDADSENRPPQTDSSSASQETEKDGPKKPEKIRRTQSRSDRLVRFGKCWGRTKRAFCNIHILLHTCVVREEQLQAQNLDIADIEEEEDQQQQQLFRELIQQFPCLGDDLFDINRTDEDIDRVADLLSKGVNVARGDDLKKLKGGVIDWITPVGVTLTGLHKKVKSTRGFLHDVTGRYLCPIEYDWDDLSIRRGLREGTIPVSPLQWPSFLWEDLKTDPEDIWKGFFKSKILILAYKYVFLAPSSVDGECKSNRSGNAKRLGISSVTAASLAYIATLVRFSLGTAGSFTRDDTDNDSQQFYTSLVVFLESEDEEEEVSELLKWWNGMIFPNQTMCQAIGSRVVSVPVKSALAQFEKRRKKSKKNGKGAQGRPPLHTIPNPS